MFPSASSISARSHEDEEVSPFPTAGPGSHQAGMGYSLGSRERARMDSRSLQYRTGDGPKCLIDIDPFARTQKELAPFRLWLRAVTTPERATPYCLVREQKMDSGRTRRWRRRRGGRERH